jgi:hypothetical protein
MGLDFSSHSGVWRASAWERGGKGGVSGYF